MKHASLAVSTIITVLALVKTALIGTLSIDDVGSHGRSPEVIFHLSSAVAMDTPSVPDERSRRQRRTT